MRLSIQTSFLRQLFHSIWQIIAVGGGAPIGKEAAYEEVELYLQDQLEKYVLSL